MNQIKISIIVPAYNIDKYISRCIDSILLQTHRNIEVIVVNDGSTDNTASEIQKYNKNDTRIKIINKLNGGVSSARLAGIYASTGDYIGFVDGDDYVEPDMFKHLLHNAIKYEADISHCGYQMIFPDGHIDMYHNTRMIKVLNNEQGLRELLCGKYIEPGVCNKLYKRNVVVDFEKSDLWDDSIKNNEDLLMNYIIFSRANCSVFDDIPFYHYILRQNSATTAKGTIHKIKDPKIVLETILKDIQEDTDLYSVAMERYCRILIGISLQDKWEEEAIVSRNILKKNLKLIRKTLLNNRIYYMSIGIVYMLPIYKIVRKIYDLVTGIDKKYNID